MKIHGLGDEVFFDEFPKEFRPNQMVFITNLYYITSKSLPKEIRNICTTDKLATQLTLYFRSKGATQLSADNFVILHPSMPVEVVLNNELMSVLACEAKEASRNLMILIRKGGKVTHLYAGINTDIRSAVMDRTFANWISQGVERLYMELYRATEKCDDREMNNAIEMIEKTLNAVGTAKVHLIVPLLGYEYFIQKLFEKFRGRVALKGALREMYSNLTNQNQENLEQNKTKPNIIIDSECPTMDQIKNEHKLFKCTTIKITEKETLCANPATGYCELFWSPLPTPFHLKMLATLVHPVHIYGITEIHDLTLKLPDYLKQLCTATKPKTPLKSSQPKSSLNSNQPKSPLKSNRQKSTLKPNQPKSTLKPKDTKNTSLTGELPTKEDISPNMNTSATLRIRKRELQYLSEFESDDSL